jgi:hypothetical protein
MAYSANDDALPMTGAAFVPQDGESAMTPGARRACPVGGGRRAGADQARMQFRPAALASYSFVSARFRT